MIRMLHGADLHLDSPFSSFAPQERAEYRQLQRELPGKLARLANAADCQLLLLSGDVFDSEEVHPKTLQALQEAFMIFRGRVFISPGNHDPYTEQSVWAQIAWPENVHVFKTAYECVTIEELGCCVHGGAFLEQICMEPIRSAQDDDYIHIGVYHGEVSAESPYRAITKEQIRHSGLNYLALGHIHKRSFPQKLGKTWYGWPGVTMSRGFDEPGQCGALLVSLQKGNCTAEFLPIENPTYETLTVPGGTAPEIPKGSDRIHCRMRFVGSSQPIDREKILKTYGDQFLSLDVIDETTPLQDVWQWCEDSTLRGIALAWLRQQPDGEFAAQYLLAALEGGEEP